MSKSVKYIGGVGSRYAQALSKTGIRTIEQLLEQGADRNGRLRISKLSSINESKILKWVHTSDLFRVKGIAGQYSELLLIAGVHSLVDLKSCDAESLVETLRGINKVQKLCKISPNIKAVTSWIEQANALTPLVKI